jgi:phenylacetate-coenzyme A ligase PaaK-like adenylate-forming protein
MIAPAVTKLSGRDAVSYAAYCRGWRMLAKERIVHPLTFGYWEDCLSVDCMSRTDLLQLQAGRLRALMEHAIKHVPYYRNWARERGLRAEAPPPLERWPIATKTLFRSDIEAFQSEVTPVGKMRTAKTSGSSGEPFQLRVHRSSTDYSYACLWRSLRRHGLRPGDRRVYIWGRSYEFNATDASIRKVRMRQQIRNWFNNTLAINAYDLTNDNVDAAIDMIERFRPVYLHGYVSALYAIARRMVDSNRTFRAFTPTAVITESEKLYDFQRVAMGAAFGCRILEHFGSVEFGNIAQPDTAGLLRIAEDLYKLETLPTGELLVTNLLSQGFPLIRYRLGDLAVIAEPPSGNDLPYGVLAEITGRTVDLIPVRAGGYIHGVALAHVIDPHLPYVRKFQIHQTALDRFVVRLASERGVPDDVPARIKHDLVKLVGASAAIEVQQVDDILPAASGKFRWVISDVSDIADRVIVERRGES